MIYDQTKVLTAYLHLNIAANQLGVWCTTVNLFYGSILLNCCCHLFETKKILAVMRLLDMTYYEL